MAVHQNHAVLVTGGRGFIGRAVCSLLNAEGFRVLSLDLGAGDGAVPDDFLTGDDFCCNLADPAALKCVFERERIGGLIHLAAMLPTAAQRDPERATRVNIEGSLNVLEMSRQFGVQRVVFGSSLSVYGSCPAEELVTEARAAAPEDLYGAAKLYAERLGDAYRSLHGVEFVSLRIGRVIGAGANSKSSAWRSQIFEYLRSRARVEICVPFVSSERILLVHVEETARMLVALLTAPKVNHGLYNACCESVVVADLKRELESLNANLRIALGSQRAAGNPRRLDCSRFEQEFNFRPKAIFEQLRNAARNPSA